MPFVGVQVRHCLRLLVVQLLLVNAKRSQQNETLFDTFNSERLSVATTATSTAETMEPPPSSPPLLELRQASAADVGGNGQQLAIERSFLCIPLLRLFYVELRQALRPDERVGVSGSHERLGKWQVERSLALQPKGLIDGHERWFLRVPICSRERIHYRYFVFVDDDGNFGGKRIRRWEGVAYARLLEPYEMFRHPGLDIFGRIYEAAVGDVERGRGWLRNEYVIELQFKWQRHLRLQRRALSATRGRLPQWRLTLATLNNAGGNESATFIEVSCYGRWRSANAASIAAAQFRPQPPQGVPYADGDVVIFQITMPLRMNCAYQLVVSALDGQTVGEVIVLPVDLVGEAGVLRLPIHAAPDGLQVGHLKLPYLIVRPLPSAGELNFRVSFQRYWPLNWPTLDVGHRGGGGSFYKARARHTENTIASFLHVQRLHGDMVELDVQLTRDYVPIVWSNFGFYTAPRGHHVHSDRDLHYVLIKDLTYRQLKRSRVFVDAPAFMLELTELNMRNTSAPQRFFPTLTEVYAALPATLGLLVEIKWPQPLHGGVAEASQTLDKNRYVDVIVETSARNGCGRPLIFASFDADICSMVRLKQNVFPALLLSSGGRAQWRPYRDLRTRLFHNAVAFAQAANLLGTAAHADDLLAAPHLIDLGLDQGQAVFVWGEALNDGPTLAKLRRMAASGLIYDRMDLHRAAAKRHSFFAAPELVEIFGQQCQAVGNMSTNESARGAGAWQTSWSYRLSNGLL